MFTIKYTDRDGLERLTTGSDIRVKRDGRQARSVGWTEGYGGGLTVSFPTTVYVMNEAGATVGKYVGLGDQA